MRPRFLRWVEAYLRARWEAYAALAVAIVALFEARGASPWWALLCVPVVFGVPAVLAVFDLRRQDEDQTVGPQVYAEYVGRYEDQPRAVVVRNDSEHEARDVEVQTLTLDKWSAEFDPLGYIPRRATRSLRPDISTAPDASPMLDNLFNVVHRVHRDRLARSLEPGGQEEPTVEFKLVVLFRDKAGRGWRTVTRCRYDGLTEDLAESKVVTREPRRRAPEYDRLPR